MDRSRRTRLLARWLIAAGLAAVNRPAGAEVAAHLVHGDTPIRRAIPCAECHACPGAAPVWGTLASAAGASPAWSAAGRSCAGVYCHGAAMRSPPAQAPVWGPVTPDYGRPPAETCTRCHGWPPAAPHPQMTSCEGCHPATVRADGSIDTAGGHHIDGRVDFAGGAGMGCASCHGFPPATGAHLAHFGLTGAAGSGQYGEITTLQDRFPEVAPTAAPAVYAFGCGQCHPLDPAKHFDQVVEVELRDGAAPAGSLKARAGSAAAYDPATGTCSGVYCHSSGQENPAYLVTPGWRSGAKLGCGGCHDNPPRYPSGGAGAGDANTHLVMSDDGWEFGHFLGLPGPWHTSKHGGGAWGPPHDAAPITCQACHYDTTDPTNTGPSGFYYLDTTGQYQLPGGDPGRLQYAVYQQLRCTSCHTGSGSAPPVGIGRVLPLRHVNGARDVVFDARAALPEYPGLPPAPDRPALPYWVTNVGIYYWPAGVALDGGTASFSLSGASYDRSTKSCSSVLCHMSQGQVTWGESPVGMATCNACHGY